MELVVSGQNPNHAREQQPCSENSSNSVQVLKVFIERISHLSLPVQKKLEEQKITMNANASQIHLTPRDQPTPTRTAVPASPLLQLPPQTAGVEETSGTVDFCVLLHPLHSNTVTLLVAVRKYLAKQTKEGRIHFWLTIQGFSLS